MSADHAFNKLPLALAGMSLGAVALLAFYTHTEVSKLNEGVELLMKRDVSKTQDLLRMLNETTAKVDNEKEAKEKEKVPITADKEQS